MTVEVYVSPGTETYRSTRFAATVNEAPAYVYGYSRTMKLRSEIHTYNTAMELSWLTIGTDETVTVDLERLSGGSHVNITSVEVYPRDVATATITETGYLTLVVPANTRLRIEVNGDRGNTMHLFTSPVEKAVPSGAVSFADGEPPSCSVDESILFAAGGVYDLGGQYVVESGGTIHIEGGAVVIGAFDLTGSQNVAIQGNGVLLGTFATPETVEPLSFTASLPYAMFLGRDGVTWDYSNEVSGITVVAAPFFLAVEGVWSWRNVQYLNPWYWSCDGFECSPHPSTEASEVVDCYAYTGDDAIKLDAGNPYGTTTVSGSFFSTVSNGVFGFGYWGANDSTTTDIHDCYAMHMGLADVDSAVVGSGIERGQNTVFKIWVDQPEATSTYGRRNISIDNVAVLGPMLSRLFSFENLPYVWDETLRNDGLGEIENIIISDLTVEEEPGQISRIFGTDATSTPHDISFDRVTIGGVTLTTDNWDSYVETNTFPFNITVDGVEIGTPTDPPFVVEDGTALSTSNSYISVADADTYHLAQGNPTEWSTATTAEKQDALRQATLSLDLNYGQRWAGIRYSSEQALDWPRAYAVDSAGNDIASDEIPVRLARAAAVAALLHLRGETLTPTTRTTGDVANESNTVGEVSRSVSYRGGKPAETGFPVLDRMLSTAGLISGGGGWGFASV